MLKFIVNQLHCFRLFIVIDIHISQGSDPKYLPHGWRGSPNFPPLLGPEGPYLSFKSVVPHLTGRGRGARQIIFNKIEVGLRGELYSKIESANLIFFFRECLREVNSWVRMGVYNCLIVRGLIPIRGLFLELSAPLYNIGLTFFLHPGSMG